MIKIYLTMISIYKDRPENGDEHPWVFDVGDVVVKGARQAAAVVGDGLQLRRSLIKTCQSKYKR
jgi:hypothetical protein